MNKNGELLEILAYYLKILRKLLEWDKTSYRPTLLMHKQPVRGEPNWVAMSDILSLLVLHKLGKIYYYK